ncbi:MAG: DNA-directed RNA polymerase subunit H [Candidatus Micrarchaeia archaeon]
MGGSRPPLTHELVPKHEILQNPEEVLSALKVDKSKLPKIHIDDPAIAHLEVKVGDIIKITRNDTTGGNAYYRVVIK